MHDLNLIYAFGLETLLSEVDDTQLWETALRQHWAPPDDPGCMVEALRFGIGRRLGEGETPRGDINAETASRSGLVDVDEWAFDRLDDAHLRPRFLGPVRGSPGSILIQLTFARPSLNEAQAAVYAATSSPGAGSGSTYLWRRLDDGSWEQSGEQLASWMA